MYSDRMKTIFTLSASFLLLACSGGDNTAVDGSADGTTPTDGSSGMDATMNNDSSTNDSGGMDSGGGDSSMDSGFMLDGGNLTCTKPADCADAGNNDVCCGTITLGGGNPPQCMINNYGSACKTANSCPTQLSLMCNSTEQVRACAKNADCTEQTYNKCCTFMMNNQTLSFCLNDQLAMFAGGTCQ